MAEDDSNFCFDIETALQNSTSFAEEASNNVTITTSMRLAMNSFLKAYSFVERVGWYQACYLRPPYNNRAVNMQNDFLTSLTLMRNLYANNIPYGCITYMMTIAGCFCGVGNDGNYSEEQGLGHPGCQPTDQVCQCGYPIYDINDNPRKTIIFNATPIFTAAMILYLFTIPAALTGFFIIPFLILSPKLKAYIIPHSSPEIASILALVLWLKTPQLRTVTNICLMNLIVSNGLAAGLRLPIKLLDTFMSTPHKWIIAEPFWFADASCRIFQTFREISMISTAYLLALIGYERYQAVCNPLESQRQLSRGRARRLVVAIWIWSAILSIPAAYVNGAILGPEDFGYHPACDNLQLDVATDITRDEVRIVTYSYQLFVAVSQFFLPSAILIVVYGKILVTLMKRNRNVELLCDDRDLPDISKNKKQKVHPVEQEQPSGSGRVTSSAETFDSTITAQRTRRLRDLSARRSRRATLMCCYCLAAFIALWAPLQMTLTLQSIRWLWPDEMAGIEMFSDLDKLALFDAIASMFCLFNPAIYCGTNGQWRDSAKKLFGCYLRSSSSSVRASHEIVMKEKSSTISSREDDSNKRDDGYASAPDNTANRPPKKTSTELNTSGNANSHTITELEEQRNVMADVLTYRRHVT